MNPEHYHDPTAEQGIDRAERDERKRRRQLLATVLRYVATNAGFDILTLVVRDRKTGGTFKL